MCQRLRPMYPRLRPHVSEGCRPICPMYQVREAREGEGEGMRRLEGRVQRLTEQCEVESAVRCDMHALAHPCRSSPSEPVSYDACRCVRTSRRACASSVRAPCSSAGGAPTQKRAPTRRSRTRGAPRPARAPPPRATWRRCRGGTRSDLSALQHTMTAAWDQSYSHQTRVAAAGVHVITGGPARAAGRTGVRGAGGAHHVPAATLSPM